MQAQRYIGIMSGTSLDGVDVVLAQIDATSVVQLARYNHEIPERLKMRILAICQGQGTTLAEIGEIDALLGELYAESVNRLLAQQQLSAADIAAIGNHGQTVWHAPQTQTPFTLQLGDNNRLAAITNIMTIGDFRRRDIAYGGQGAPLVPAFHHALLADNTQRRVVLNIGGISNVSLLFPDAPIKGFDTGPGNMLLDAWILHCKGLHYDKDATWSRSGKIEDNLLTQLRRDPFFALPAPKSTGREHFNLAWLQQQLSQYRDTYGDIPPEDVQATLVALTVSTVIDQITAVGGCDQLMVCGGGAQNPEIMRQLKEALPTTEVGKTDKWGVSGDDMEALAFAWLAYRTVNGLSGNLPSVTGASQETILGAIYPKNSQYLLKKSQ